MSMTKLNLCKISRNKLTNNSLKGIIDHIMNSKIRGEGRISTDLQKNWNMNLCKQLSDKHYKNLLI